MTKIGSIRKFNSVRFELVARGTIAELSRDKAGSFGIYTDISNIRFARKQGDKNVPRVRVIKNKDGTESIYLEVVE